MQCEIFENTEGSLRGLGSPLRRDQVEPVPGF